MKNNEPTVSELLLIEMRRLNENLESHIQLFHQENKKIWMEIAAMKVKAGVWGLAGGALAVFPSLVMWYLSTKH